MVSFTATVGFALAVGPIDDDDNAGDDVVVGDVDEVGPMLPAGITLLEGGFDEELEGGLDNVGPTMTPSPPVEGALPDGEGDIDIAGP